MAEGFLGRWSRRKQEARGAEPPAAAPADVAPAPQPVAQPVPAAAAAAAAPGAAAPAAAAQPVAAAPLPTLQDVQALTPESDFSAFVARGVAPEVRNAAMKKLFSDPHFNLMDGLDVYIEDYTQHVPLPLDTLRRLASAQALGLVQEPAQEGAGGDDVAQSDLCNAIPSPQVPAAAPPQGGQEAGAPSHDSDAQDVDLRLQPDHASGSPGTGHGPA